MSHANDRTLLASLGFADKDRTLGRHTLACEWAASKGGANAILSAASADPAIGQDDGFLPEAVRKWWGDGGRTEVHITKGDGQYKTTIGFADVVLNTCFELDGNPPYMSYGKKVGVEVKITPIDTASIVRQIALYRCYGQSLRESWVLLVDWELTELEVISLRREKIVPLRLGRSFEEFCELQGGIAKIASL